MDAFYWALIGVLVALVAKVQIPTDKDENMPVLVALAVGGAIAGGLAMRTFAQTGILSMGWVSHVTATVGAIVLVLGMRIATRQHLA